MVQAPKFDLGTAIHDDLEAGGFGPGCRILIDDADLHPDGFIPLSSFSEIASSTIPLASSGRRKISTISRAPARRQGQRSSFAMDLVAGVAGLTGTTRYPFCCRYFIAKLLGRTQFADAPTMAMVDVCPRPAG